MIDLKFELGDEPVVLCLGAHCDDIEIGCGGTLLEFGELYSSSMLHCRVFTGNETREAETRAALADLAAGWKSAEIQVHRFRNGYFPFVGADLKDAFEELKDSVRPDLVLTHYRHDRHQDHRMISDLTWNTFRGHLILEYEIPKYDGDMGRPNAYVEISPENVRNKADCLERHFVSQRDKQWFSGETFISLMRLRGIECASKTGYAEAFYARKAKLAL